MNGKNISSEITNFHSYHPNRYQIVLSQKWCIRLANTGKFIPKVSENIPPRSAQSTWYIVCILSCAWVCVLWWSDGWYSNDIIMIFWWSITCFSPTPSPASTTMVMIRQTTVIILFHHHHTSPSQASQHGRMVNDFKKTNNCWQATCFKFMCRYSVLHERCNKTLPISSIKFPLHVYSM